MRIVRLRRLAILPLCLLLTLSSALSGSSGAAQQKRRAAAPSPGKKIRLVVGIVIDQFRYDYLTRFQDQFGEGGFKRLLSDGAVFANANYVHTPTYTACGHATFMSGATPAMNGIIGNEWYDRDSAKRVTSVNDEKTKLVGGKEGSAGMSPHRLIGTTLGDEMKLATEGQAKVVGISYKDRSAILPSGKHPNGAYWYSLDTGNFVTSDYYLKDLPGWVKAFNRDQHSDKYFGKVWERLLPETAYQRSEPDDAPYRKPHAGMRFPYTLNGGEEKPGAKFYNQFEASPFANDHLVNFAKAAIESEQLGADDTPDLLTISFSSNDLVGHSFGPYSQEVQDITLRTDRALAELFSYLDRKIGFDHVLVALTADHGVAPVPEQVRALGYGGRVEAKQATDAVTAALNQRYGDDKWILTFVNGNIYFDESVISRRKLDLEEVETVASQAVMKIHGIAAAVTGTQIMAGRLPNTPIAASIANGYFPTRNGNLIIVPRPFYLFGEGVTATHGTPYSYDTHVPVILFGPGVTAGRYPGVTSPADIAPTLSWMLRVEKPSNAVGRILTEALRPQSP
jgi:predicted AlkP superfamily pyrophosphatase or phosphodiesterase